MPVTLRQIVRWNDGELTTPAINDAIASARPQCSEDIFFMDALAQKLRACLLTSLGGVPHKDIGRVRDGQLKLNPVSALWDCGLNQSV